MATTLGTRLAFNNAKAAMSRDGKSMSQAVLSQSFLRFEVGLSTNQTQYKFDVLVNENSNSSNFLTTNKLNLQDAFYMSQIGFFVAAPASATDTAFELYSYPNITAFTAANADQLKSLYNGYMSLTINQRVILPFWDLSRHYCVNQTQQTGATNYDQLNLGGDGFYPMEPNIVLSGDKKNNLTVTLPTGLTAVAANSRLVCIVRGILAQNISSVN